MKKVKFIIDVDKIRNPYLVISMIKQQIELMCGESLIEAPKGYLKEIGIIK